METSDKAKDLRGRQTADSKHLIGAETMRQQSGVYLTAMREEGSGIKRQKGSFPLEDGRKHR